MEMTYEQWKIEKKGIRRRLSTSGWVILGYYFIMNAAVIAWILAGTVFALFQEMFSAGSSSVDQAVMEAAESGWGYLLAIAIGVAVLLIWKKPRYFRDELFCKGAPMKAGSFLTLLCLFFSGQLIYQMGTTFMEVTLNAFGYTMMEGLANMQIDFNNVSMFLYAGIFGPVAEELLFRGVVQRSLLPFGKKFAILVSALTFGLFHGNLIQTPYAFFVGLVLGYVAAEYNILWAMVMHVMNNMVLADLLPRMLGGFGDEFVALSTWMIIIAFTVGAIVQLIRKRDAVSAWLRKHRLEKEYVKCYFSCAGTITLLVVMVLTIIMTTAEIVTPLS